MIEKGNPFELCMVCGKRKAPPETGICRVCAGPRAATLFFSLAVLIGLSGCVSFSRYQADIAQVCAIDRQECLADLNQIDLDFKLALAEKDKRIRLLESEITHPETKEKTK